MACWARTHGSHLKAACRATCAACLQAEQHHWPRQTAVHSLHADGDGSAGGVGVSNDDGCTSMGSVWYMRLHTLMLEKLHAEMLKGSTGRCHAATQVTLALLPFFAGATSD